MGLQHRRTGAGAGERYWIPEKPSRLYFVQNDEGARLWPAGDELVQNLLSAFQPESPGA